MTVTIGSVSGWIDRLKQGDREATHELWERYFKRLIEFVRRKFPNMSSEEDVVAATLASFFSDVEDGRLPDLNDRSAAWKLLVVKSSQRALDYIRAENAAKRRGAAPPLHLEQGATPAALAEMADLWSWLLSALGDSARGRGLRQIAVWKLEDWTNAQIAQELNVSIRTVERKLDLLRKCWTQALARELGSFSRIES